MTLSKLTLDLLHLLSLKGAWCKLLSDDTSSVFLRSEDDILKELEELSIETGGAKAKVNLPSHHME